MGQCRALRRVQTASGSLVAGPHVTSLFILDFSNWNFFLSFFLPSFLFLFVFGLSSERFVRFVDFFKEKNFDIYLIV